MQLRKTNGTFQNEERNYLPHGLDEELHDRHRHCHPEPVAQQLVEETACQDTIKCKSFKTTTSSCNIRREGVEAKKMEGHLIHTPSNKITSVKYFLTV